MDCPRCERENHPDAHSCEWCETPLGGGRVIHRPDPSTADLTTRVIAKVIDLPFTAAALIAASLIPAAVPASETVQLGLILVGSFGMIVQLVLLSSHGQTIGKKLMGLRFVRADTGRNGGFVTNVLLRAGVNGLLGMTIIYFVVDSLFLLFRNRLCLHDYIAGTKVVKVVQ